MFREKFLQKIILFSFIVFLFSVARVLFSSEFSNLYLNWNLFLAVLPLVFIFAYLKHKSKFRHFILFLSLIFLPNAPYLVTDFKHLPLENSPFFYFDIVLFFVFAFMGVVIWFFVMDFLFLEIRKIKFFGVNRNFLSHSFIILFSVISAFAVFIGRSQELRFNSWDILYQPYNVLMESINLLIHPFSDKDFLPIIFSFSFLLIFIFYFGRVFFKSK